MALNEEPTTKIHAVLGELVTILDSVDERFWSAQARSALLVTDPVELRIKVLSWFGGMGSLNDLILCKINGFPGPDAELDDRNERLSTCLDRLYRTCRHEQRTNF